MRSLLSILITIAFTLLILHHSIEEQRPVKAQTDPGYTVLDSERVIMANGDTVRKDWQMKIKLFDSQNTTK